LEEIMIKTSHFFFAATLAAGAALTSAPAAQAMPISPAPAASDPHPLMQDVSWPCGPGMRLNRWGRCVPKWGWGPPRPYHRPHHWRRYRHW
jgi:hypothetical protein